MMDVSKPPPELKSIAMHMRTAVEHNTRDPVISYYCKLYSVQKGLELPEKNTAVKSYLSALLDDLDNMKKSHSDNEYIKSESKAFGYVQNYGLKLFRFAYQKDACGDFSPATMKAFLSSGLVLDVLEVIGTVDEEVEKARKYGKWKAIYITQCKKNGEEPIAGPIIDQDDEAIGPDMERLPKDTTFAPSSSGPSSSGYHAPPSQNQPANPPASLPSASSTVPVVPPSPSDAPAASTESLTPLSDPRKTFSAAEKAAKYAISAMQYQDRDTAIRYLMESMQMLKTG